MLAATWQSSGVSVYQSAPEPSDSYNVTGSNNIITFGKKELLNNRALYTEAHASFLVFQSQISSSENQSKKQEIITSFSHVYLALIKTHIDQLARSKTNPTSQTNFSTLDTETIREQISYWNDIFRFWHLSELFITSPLNYIHGAMNNWIRRSIQIPANKSNPQDLISNWDLLYHHVIRGDMINSIPMFRKLCQQTGITTSEQQQAQKIEILLSSLPKLGNSLSQFERIWKQWHQDCVDMTNDSTVMDNKFFAKLLGILIGDTDSLRSCDGIHWLELLGAEILFKYPTMTNHGVRQLLQQIVDPKTVQPQERILGYIIQGDVSAVLSSLKRNWGTWVVAHMTDLFYHAGVLSENETERTKTRELALIAYATEMLTDNRFWQLAFSYLTFCENEGKTVLAHFIECIPLDSERKAFKLLNLCRMHKLTNQEKTISQVMAMKSLQQGRMGACMDWLHRIKDDVRMSQVVNKMISSATNFKDVEAILDSLGSDFVFSTNLKFLADFQDLLEHSKDGNLIGTKDSVMMILCNKNSPSKLRIAVITEFVPKLLKQQHQSVILDSEELYTLMSEIEDICLFHELHPAEMFPEKQRENIEQTRFQLVQHLSQVFVEQGFAF